MGIAVGVGVSSFFVKCNILICIVKRKLITYSGWLSKNWNGLSRNIAVLQLPNLSMSWTYIVPNVVNGKGSDITVGCKVGMLVLVGVGV